MPPKSRVRFNVEMNSFLTVVRTASAYNGIFKRRRRRRALIVRMPPVTTEVHGTGPVCFSPSVVPHQTPRRIIRTIHSVTRLLSRTQSRANYYYPDSLCFHRQSVTCFQLRKYSVCGEELLVEGISQWLVISCLRKYAMIGQRMFKRLSLGQKAESFILVT